LCVNNITYLVARFLLHPQTVTLNYMTRSPFPAHVCKAVPQAPVWGSEKSTNLTVSLKNLTL